MAICNMYSEKTSTAPPPPAPADSWAAAQKKNQLSRRASTLAAPPARRPGGQFRLDARRLACVLALSSQPLALLPQLADARVVGVGGGPAVALLRPLRTVGHVHVLDPEISGRGDAVVRRQRPVRADDAPHPGGGEDLVAAEAGGTGDVAREAGGGDAPSCTLRHGQGLRMDV
eukprot:scaffold14551_cov123-Isochrysis_galbana.AAC.3